MLVKDPIVAKTVQSAVIMIDGMREMKEDSRMIGGFLVLVIQRFRSSQ